MPEQPKHPDAADLPHPSERHGGEHGVIQQSPDDKPTGLPSHDRHETEATPGKDHDGSHSST